MAVDRIIEMRIFQPGLFESRQKINDLDAGILAPLRNHSIRSFRIQIDLFAQSANIIADNLPAGSRQLPALKGTGTLNSLTSPQRSNRKNGLG